MGLLDTPPQQEEYYDREQTISQPQQVAMQQELRNNDVFLFRLQNEDMLKEIEHQLRGEALENGKWKKVHDAWANDEGISKIISVLSNCGLNKNIHLGNLTHDEIYTRCRVIWCELAKLFCFSWARYEIPKQNRSMLIQIVIQQVHSSLSRSEMGNEARQLSTMTSRVEHFMHENKPQPSFFNPARYLSRREK